MESCKKLIWYLKIDKNRELTSPRRAKLSHCSWLAQLAVAAAIIHPRRPPAADDTNEMKIIITQSYCNIKIHSQGTYKYNMAIASVNVLLDSV